MNLRSYEAIDSLGSCMLRIRSELGSHCKIAFVTPGADGASRRYVTLRNSNNNFDMLSSSCSPFCFIIFVHTRRALLGTMLDVHCNPGQASNRNMSNTWTPTNADSSSGVDDVASSMKSLDVSIMRVASSKHLVALREALDECGEDGLEAVIASFHG